MAFIPAIAASAGAAGTAAGTIGTIASVASAAFGVLSAVQTGRMNEANAQSQANIADYNAKVAENNAVTARREAAANEEAQRREAAIALGRQRAGAVQAGGGLDSSGLYGQSVGFAELDAKNILYAGEVKAQGLDSTASSERESASTYRSNAGQARTATWLTAGAAAASGYGNYLRTQQLAKGLDTTGRG